MLHRLKIGLTLYMFVCFETKNCSLLDTRGQTSSFISKYINYQPSHILPQGKPCTVASSVHFDRKIWVRKKNKLYCLHIQHSREHSITTDRLAQSLEARNSSRPEVYAHDLGK
jgi:hypothetical protein